MHSSRMRTVRTLPYVTPAWTETPLPGQRPPALDTGPPPPAWTETTRTETLPGQSPPPDREPHEKTDTCENITFANLRR